MTIGLEGEALRRYQEAERHKREVESKITELQGDLTSLRYAHDRLADARRLSMDLEEHGFSQDIRDSQALMLKAMRATLDYRYEEICRKTDELRGMMGV